MARANAANDLVRAGSLQGLARALAQPGHLRMEEVEPLLRRMVPMLVGAFLVILIIGVGLQISQSRERVFEDAAADLELIGAVAGMQIDNAAPAANADTQADALLAALPNRAFAAGRQILLTRVNGDIVASYPHGLHIGAGQTLADRLGYAQPLTVFGQKAGVLRIALPDGTEALATVRDLKAPYGQIAIIHPLAGLLGEWWSTALRVGLILAATAVALMAIATAYLWQCWRAHTAERHYGQVHGRIDTALNRGRCGLWDWDLGRGRIYWSESMYAMLGMQAAGDFVSFGDIKALVHPLDNDLSDVAEKLAAAEVQAIDHVFRLRNVEGAWVWLRVRGELVREPVTNDPYLVGIAVDITDEKRLAERSATADRRLSDAIEAISESFALWNRDGRLVTCNARYMRLHQVDSALFPVETAPLVAPPTSPWSLSASLVPQTRELQLDDRRWLQVSEHRTKDGGLVAVGTDITALKLQEERLLDSERRLMATVADLRRSRQTLEAQTIQLADMAERHLEKKIEAESANRAKSEFLGRMSHELRTPLNAIIGFSELMCSETFGPLGSPKYVGYATDIKASGECLLSLITDVLEMSRLEAGRVHLRRSLFPVEEPIVKVAASLAPLVATKRLNLQTETLPGCVLHADRGAVERVLETILANACKFTAEGDAISVRARNANGALNIFVANTGAGIAPEAIARIGRPFEQVGTALRNGMSGSGLGIAIARSLLDLHGASLRIKSRLGEGTVVMIRFPLPVESAPKSMRRLSATTRA